MTTNNHNQIAIDFCTTCNGEGVERGIRFMTTCPDCGGTGIQEDNDEITALQLRIEALEALVEQLKIYAQAGQTLGTVKGQRQNANGMVDLINHFEANNRYEQ